MRFIIHTTRSMAVVVIVYVQGWCFRDMDTEMDVHWVQICRAAWAQLERPDDGYYVAGRCSLGRRGRAHPRQRTGHSEGAGWIDRPWRYGTYRGPTPTRYCLPFFGCYARILDSALVIACFFMLVICTLDSHAYTFTLAFLCLLCSNTR